jgi:hypothetical protein
MQSLIVPIFKYGDRNIPSNYRTIMINLISAKLYGIILENKISLWLETHGKRAKVQYGFRIYHSIVDHLVGSLQRSFAILKPIFCVVLLTLETRLT